MVGLTIPHSLKVSVGYPRNSGNGQETSLSSPSSST